MPFGRGVLSPVLAILVAFLIVSGLLPGFGVATAAEVPASPITSTAAGVEPDETRAPVDLDPPVAPDKAEQAASQQALKTGEPVVVDALTTETTEVIALPEGGFRADISARPTRMSDGDEGWVDLDATLVERADGRIEPRASLNDLTLSAGGPSGTVLASFASGDHVFTLRSPYALPEPVLDGEMATYADVLPGVDLVTKASDAGFSHNWVVKTREAASDPRVRSLSLPLNVDGLTSHKVDGGIEYLDEHGARQFWTPTPMMWDSSSETAETGSDEPVRSSADAVEQGPIQADQVALVAATSDQDSLDLKADASLLDDPDATFPVVIDPTLTKDVYGWTAVWDNYPTKSFWKTDHTLGAGYEGYEQMKVVRSYFRFDTTALAGKYIGLAEMNVRQVHAASCSARETYVYRTGAIGTTTTWNNQPTRYNYQSSSSSTAGCGSTTAMVGWNVLEGTRAIASGNVTKGTFMIRAKSETDKVAWKQYDDAGAELSVHYLSIPATPKYLFVKTSSKTYSCGTSTTSLPTIGIVGTQQVTVGATVSSADASQYVDLDGVFRRRDLAASADMADIAGSLVASNSGVSQLAWSVSDKTYRFQVYSRARATWSGVTHYAKSAFNGSWCYFKIDSTAPKPPIVTAVDFTECASPEASEQCAAMGSTHVGGAFKFKGANTDAVSYTWKLNDQPEQTVATSSGAERTVTVTPDRVLNVLTVRAVDAAGTKSLEEIYTFKVNKLAPNVRWIFDDPQSLNTNLGTDSTASVVTASTIPTAYGRVLGAISNVGAPVPAYVGTVPTTADFTAAAWVRADVNQASSFLAATAGSGSDQFDAFELGYDPTTNSWTAGRRTSTGTFTGATSPTALTGAWTHLAATYQASTNKITLYVNGVARASATYPTAAQANTGWRLACGVAGASSSRCMNGSLDDVQLYVGALFSDEIVDLANPVFTDPNGIDGHPAVSTAALWAMDDPSSSTQAVDQAFGGNLNLVNMRRDAAGNVRDAFVPTGLGTPERVLLTPGITSQLASVNHAAVDSLGSFSVAARVHLTDPTKSMVIAQQAGANGVAWTLGWEGQADGSGRWVFQRNPADGGNGIPVEVRSQLEYYAADDFETLQGVYNAREGVIKLFVAGRTFEAEPDPVTQALPSTSFLTPWVARGVMQVGNGSLNGVTAPFVGEIDRVDLVAGAYDAFTAFVAEEGMAP